MDEAEYCGRLALIYRGKIIAMGAPSELKAKTLKQGVLEVECDPLVPAMDLLGKEGWVYEAAIFGDALHVIGREGIDVKKEIAALFQAQKIGMKRMEWIRPSLEDVFVSLVDKEESR
jgi:ABC-2 type transport system ATP-binding protein